MNIADSVAKAVVDVIDHSYIPTMIDLVKQETSTSSTAMSFTRMLDTDILEGVRINAFQQHILFEVYVKNDQQRLGHIALRHDENARKQLADCLYELEEKYDIPCTLDVCLFPACLLWHFDGKKRATSSADCEA